MNIACTSCPAKYGVPDDKVRGRKVRITCKRCGAAIIVDGTQAAPAEPAPAPEPGGERARQRTILGGLEAPIDSAPGAPRSQPPPPVEAAAKPAGAFPRPGSNAGVGAKATAVAPRAQAKAAITVPKAAATPAAPPATAAGAAAPAAVAAAPAAVAAPAVSWTVAVTDDDHRDMPTTEVVEAYAGGSIDAETFVWRDGMDDWLTPFEIPEIAAALAARGLSPRVNGEAGAGEPRDRQPSGSWREPGKWDQQGDGDPAFDDVTVAMAGQKAQELLDAVTSAQAASESQARATGPASPDAGPRPPPREPKRDLFGPAAQQEASEDVPRARMPSIPPEPHASQASLTGVRNESSVLFSLDQLTGGPLKAKSNAAAEAKVEKVDAAALMFDSKPSGGDAPSSVASLGGGAIFSAATMAAPDFTAAPQASAPVHSTPSSAPPVNAPAKKSGSGWMIGALLAVLAGGVAAFFVFKPVPAPAPEGTVPPGSTPEAIAPAAAAPPAPGMPSPAPSAATPAESAAPGESTAPAGSAAAEVSPAGSAAAPPGAPPPAAHPPTAGQTAAAPGPVTAPKPAATPKPEAPPAAPAVAEGAEFDKAAASQSLSAAAASAQGECASADGPHGTGKVTITFVNSGRATNALVSGDFAGSALGGCVARVFRSAKVPAFSGESVRVNKTVHIP